jgi:hypothetical protein
MSARVAPRLVIEGCAVATVDPNRNEYASGHLVEGGELRTADEAEVTREIDAASRNLAKRSRKLVDKGSKPEVST